MAASYSTEDPKLTKKPRWLCNPINKITRLLIKKKLKKKTFPLYYVMINKGLVNRGSDVSPARH